MRKILIPLGLASFLLLAGFFALQVARGQALPEQEGSQVLSSEIQAENARQISSPSADVPEVPTIGFIDSPTAACVQPDNLKNECYINWYYMSVNADPSYMITMTVKLNDFGYVARYNGFFQTSMYVPNSMNPEGYQVPCGLPGSGGDSNWGENYGYTIRARASDGLKSANYGSVYCPAYTP